MCNRVCNGVGVVDRPLCCVSIHCSNVLTTYDISVCCLVCLLECYNIGRVLRRVRRGRGEVGRAVDCL